MRASRGSARVAEDVRLSLRPAPDAILTAERYAKSKEPWQRDPTGLFYTPLSNYPAGVFGWIPGCGQALMIVVLVGILAVTWMIVGSALESGNTASSITAVPFLVIFVAGSVLLVRSYRR